MRCIPLALDVRRDRSLCSKSPLRITQPSHLRLGYTLDDIIGLSIEPFSMIDGDLDASPSTSASTYISCLDVEIGAQDN